MFFCQVKSKPSLLKVYFKAFANLNLELWPGSVVNRDLEHFPGSLSDKNKRAINKKFILILGLLILRVVNHHKWWSFDIELVRYRTETLAVYVLIER